VADLRLIVSNIVGEDDEINDFVAMVEDGEGQVNYRERTQEINAA